MKFQSRMKFSFRAPLWPQKNRARDWNFQSRMKFSNREWKFQARMKISCVGEWFFHAFEREWTFSILGPSGKVLTLRLTLSSAQRAFLQHFSAAIGSKTPTVQGIFGKKEVHLIWVFSVWAFCCHMWALHELHNITNFLKMISKMIWKIISKMIWDFFEEIIISKMICHYRKEEKRWCLVHKEHVGNDVAFGWVRICYSVLIRVPPF